MPGIFILRKMERKKNKLKFYWEVVVGRWAWKVIFLLFQNIFLWKYRGKCEPNLVCLSTKLCCKIPLKKFFMRFNENKLHFHIAHQFLNFMTVGNSMFWKTKPASGIPFVNHILNSWPEFKISTWKRLIELYFNNSNSFIQVEYQ